MDLHIATCSGSALQSTVTCANRAGLEVSEAVLESIAAAEATLSADERELGVCLLNIGAHSSDLAVFFEGAVAYTASVPIGGQHFTNDLAVGLQMPVAQAEELKRQYGNAVVTAVPQQAVIEIANPQPGAAATLPLRRIAEILEPRARELLYFVKESLRQGGVVEALGAGCVLTGGGAMLPGMLDITESQLRVPARTGIEFASKAMDLWAYTNGVHLYFIRPGRPVENGYIESVNGKLRGECLNVEVFFTLADARRKCTLIIPLIQNIRQATICCRGFRAVGNSGLLWVLLSQVSRSRSGATAGRVLTTSATTVISAQARPALQVGKKNRTDHSRHSRQEWSVRFNLPSI